MPERSSIILRDVRKPFRVVVGGVLIGSALAAERHVIRMGIYQDHAAMLGQPIQLAFPDFIGSLPQDDKEVVVLDQRVRKFDVAAASGIRHPERENSASTIGLRFEWISVEGGSIVFHS